MSDEDKVRRAVLRALQELWRQVYAHLQLLKQDDTHLDWREWERIFLLALYAALLDAADGNQDVYSLYLIGAEQRLRRIAETTQNAAQLEIQRYNAGEINYQELVKRLQGWFSESRAQTIAATETAYLNSAATKYDMQRQGLDRWRWVHFGGDIPCGSCIQRIGTIYNLRDPMPPIHPNDHCRAMAVTGP